MRDRVENIMRGREEPGWLRAPLAAAELLYRAGAGLRNACYDCGVFRSTQAPCKVISVGNLTVGGAGKTPFTALLARKLADRKPGVLSRGYGQTSSAPIHVVSDGATLGPAPPVSADEPYLLARKLPHVPVVCASRRLDGARAMVERFGVNVIILDDGFQHRAIHRDLDIVLVHAADPFGPGRLTPLGVLREPPRQLRRADVVVLTGGHGGDAVKSVRRFARQDTPVIAAEGKPAGFTDINGAARTAPEGPVFAFCGVANPDNVKRTFESAGLDVVELAAYRDHHWYTEPDLKSLNERAARSGAKAMVTTEKDAARLIGAPFDFDLPLAVIAWEMVVVSGEDVLDEALERLFPS